MSLATLKITVVNLSKHIFRKPVRSIGTSSVSFGPLSPGIATPLHKIQRPRRAILYVPGHDERKINKLRQLEVDCVALDCEDGVGWDKKGLARDTIHNLYQETAASFAGELCVRVNSPSSGLCELDIESVLAIPKPPQTLIVPKIDTVQEIKWFSDLLNEKYRKLVSNRPSSSPKLNLIFMTESSKGLLNLKEIVDAGIANCSSRFSCCHISGVIFGSDDFCANLGLTRSDDASELIYARQKIVTTCKAFSLQAIDMVYIDYKDDEGLKKQSEEGSKMGFSGKQVIHPNQIPTAQISFTPSEEKLKWAEELTEAYENSTEGAFTFRGQMIDLPTVLQAKNIKLFSDVLNNRKS